MYLNTHSSGVCRVDQLVRVDAFLEESSRNLAQNDWTRLGQSINSKLILQLGFRESVRLAQRESERGTSNFQVMDDIGYFEDLTWLVQDQKFNYLNTIYYKDINILSKSCLNQALIYIVLKGRKIIHGIVNNFSLYHHFRSLLIQSEKLICFVDESHSH